MKSVIVLSTLEGWGRNLHSKFWRGINICKKKLEQLRDNNDETSISSVNFFRTKLASFLVQEESYWRQRAKSFWLKDGDANTKFFFHTAASTRRKQNALTSISSKDGSLVES